MTQAAQKGADNLQASVGALNSCVTFLRNAFQALKSELTALDDYAGAAPHIPRDLLNLKDRPQAKESLVANVRAAHSALVGAAEVLRTNLELVRLNHQGLLHVLASLNQTSPSRDAFPPRIALQTVNPRLAKIVTAAAAQASRFEARMGELATWSAQIQAHRVGSVDVDELPRWVLEQSTLPRRDSWSEYALLPEGEADVDRVVQSLEADLSGRAPSRLARLRVTQRRLDEALGDEATVSVPAPRVSAAPPPFAPASEPSLPSASTTTGSTASYRLPGWY
jgi:hypothetical protein